MAACNNITLSNTVFLAVNAVLILLASSLSSIMLVNAAYNDVEVTRETWPEVTTGKMVLVKFFTPYCEHCEKFAPIWKQMETKYKNNEKIAIIEVNCDTRKGELLCDDHDIIGTPDVHWGDTAVTYPYRGETNFDSLVEFVETNMTKPICSVMSVDACPEEDRADMVAIDKMTTEYFEKLFAFGIDKPEDIVAQVMVKNAIKNPFKDDLDDFDPDVEADDDPLGMSVEPEL